MYFSGVVKSCETEDKERDSTYNMCIARQGSILAKTGSSIWAVPHPFSRRIRHKYLEAYTFSIRRRLLGLNMQNVYKPKSLKNKIALYNRKNYSSIDATLVRLIYSRHFICKVFLLEAELAAITGHFIRCSPWSFFNRKKWNRQSKIKPDFSSNSLASRSPIVSLKANIYRPTT